MRDLFNRFFSLNFGWFGLILFYTKFQTSALSGTGKKVYCGGGGGGDGSGAGGGGGSDDIDGGYSGYIV